MVQCGKTFRLHTAFSGAWAKTMSSVPQAKDYEQAISALCTFVKQSAGIQEQLPETLKHGGNTRPWTSIYRRAASVHTSYDTLIPILDARKRPELIQNVDRKVNEELMTISGKIYILGIFET